MTTEPNAIGNDAVNSKERAPIKWIPVAQGLPPIGELVLTKIDDAQGCRNQQRLRREGHLWFVPSREIYVYYTPTHWARD